MSVLPTAPELETIYLKDIPLNVLRDYLSDEFIQSQHFQNFLELYDRVNRNYFTETPISNDVNQFGLYKQVLIDGLIKAYNNTYETPLNGVPEDVRMFTLEMMGRANLIEDILAIRKEVNLPSTKEGSLQPIVIRETHTDVKESELRTNNEMKKEQFADTFSDDITEDENLFQNIKNYISQNNSPSYTNNIMVKHAKLYKYLIDNSYNHYDINTKEYVFLADKMERVPKGELPYIIDSLVELLVLKYENYDLSYATPPFKGIEIGSKIIDKFFEGNRAHEIANEVSQPDPSEMKKVTRGNIQDFLSKNDLMKDYKLITR